MTFYLARNLRSARIILVAVAFSSSANAFAGQELLEVDARFRSKIAKEKIRMGAQERKAEEQGKSRNQSNCGSQSIGNVDTGGRIGSSPREVFVFAPNSINIVGRGGCR